MKDTSSSSPMLSLSEYLDGKRVSELQEMMRFWGNGNPTPRRKPELRSALMKSLQDEANVHKKLRVLSQAPMQLLLILIRSDDYRADIQSVFYNDHGIQLEYYEVEAAARALEKRGFIEISRDKSWINYGKELYAIPREIGDLVSLLLAEERRGPKEVFTLAGHLTGLSKQKLRGLVKRLDYAGNGTPEPEQVRRFLTEEKGARALIRSISNQKLRQLLRRLIREYGGIISRTRYEKETGAPVRWDRKRWQRFFEQAGVGTMSNISLDEYGIAFEGESLVLFREIVEIFYASLTWDDADHDRVASARIDLLTDLAYFLRYVARNPTRVTQAKTLYKAAYGKILEGMVFKEDALVDREEVLSLVWDLALGLSLVKIDEDRILKITRAGEAWESRELFDQVERVYAHILETRAPEGRDFHVRRTRRLFEERLRTGGKTGWRPFLELPFLVRNDYLATLQEEGVRARYKNAFQYSYDPPKTSVPGLGRELTDWIVGRLFVLGLVDIAMREDAPVALRLTELGRKVLGVEVKEGAAEGQAPLVVNPDFEVLVFPEGDVLELVHTLDRFAIRTKSEEVSHYRILKEGVERAVVKGLSVDCILNFLRTHSRTPIPQNVEYSIRDWGEKIRFASQRDVVLLTVDDAKVMDELLTLPCIAETFVERIGPTAIALREPIDDWRALEELRRLGVYMKG